MFVCHVTDVLFRHVLVLKALSVGIFPYVLKLLQSSARELRPLLVFIWAKLLAVDSVRNDLAVSIRAALRAVYIVHCVSKKVAHCTLVHIFAKY